MLGFILLFSSSAFNLLPLLQGENSKHRHVCLVSFRVAFPGGVSLCAQTFKNLKDNADTEVIFQRNLNQWT